MASYRLVKETIKRNNVFVAQRENKAILTHIIPPAQNVYLQGISPAYYYLCRYNSPEIKLLGYRFPEEMSPKYICQSIPKGAYFIVDTDFIKNENCTSNFLEVCPILLSESKECIVLQKSALYH